VLSIDGSKADGVSTVSNFNYDESKVRELLSHMIIYHKYPFMPVEHVLL
jgi:hypothetical protein